MRGGLTFLPFAPKESDFSESAGAPSWQYANPLTQIKNDNKKSFKEEGFLKMELD